MTPLEIVNLLHAAYREDRGGVPPGPARAERVALADYLGGHDEMWEAIWDLWRTELELSGVAVRDIMQWLEEEFVPPAPEDPGT